MREIKSVYRPDPSLSKNDKELDEMQVLLQSSLAPVNKQISQSVRITQMIHENNVYFLDDIICT